jgi:hypothetical protein
MAAAGLHGPLPRMVRDAAGKPNVGLKMNADVVGKGLGARGEGPELVGGVLDPAAF